MLFCLARRKLEATITSQVSTSLTINSPRERKEERKETSFMHFTILISCNVPPPWKEVTFN